MLLAVRDLAASAHAGFLCCAPLQRGWVISAGALQPDLKSFHRARHKAVRAFVQVIVVDVEDRDDSVWHNLTPLDGGLSGWRLLWDRWCPVPSLRCCILTQDLCSV